MRNLFYKNPQQMKSKLLLLLIVLASIQIFGQSQGPNNPAGATYSAFGCLSCPGSQWSNWNNIFAADGLTADVGLNAFPNCFQTTCYYSRFLMASNFGFSIPAAAVIAGVTAEILRMSSASPDIKDSIVQIITGGNAGNNHADTTLWTSAPVTITYGDSTDTWGLPLIPDSVNTINFGLRIMIRNGSPVTAFNPSSIDHIQLTVYYSLPTGTFSQTRTGDFTIYPNPVTNELLIDNGQLTISNIDIYNMVGERVFSFHHSSLISHLSVDVSQLSPGIYFAIIDTGTELLKKKFIRSGN
jgi:hypothetical protein